jgi:hypothetical protein
MLIEKSSGQKWSEGFLKIKKKVFMGNEQVRINTFDSPEVRDFKAKVDDLILKCIELKSRDEASAEAAITRLQEGCMWAVKAITAPPEK